MTFSGYDACAGGITWALTFDGSSSGITYTHNYGAWTRESGIVYVAGQVVLSSKGVDTGTAELVGLPFPMAGTGLNSYFWLGMSSNLSLTSDYFLVIGPYITTATGILFYEGNGTTLTSLDSSYFTNTTSILFSGAYQAL